MVLLTALRHYFYCVETLKNIDRNYGIISIDEEVLVEIK